jgi:DNA/RNA-binding domain of Phe-tRNA-synthetase-like protein
MDLRQIQLSDSLADIARIGFVFFKQVSNGAASAVLRKRLEALSAELRQAIGDRPLSELESVKQSRKLYHALGVDPTRDRPSSERLLRRVIQNRPLPKISKLVDAVNLASLSLQCPMGVYDWDRLVPPVLVRIGRPDESLIGLNGEPMSLEGRIALVDGEGLFGNPSHDSLRSQVTLGTVRALVVAWASAETPKTHVEAALQDVIALGKEFCEARAGEWGILG